MKQIITILAAVMALSPCLAYGQDPKAQYIEKYSDMAVRQMTESGVPASITLAQGILESDSGRSALAVKANNHFGIKCSNWEGKTYRQDDDAPNECFRKYDSVEQSFADHSDFLRFKVRYRDLFALEPTDYKGWAYGLKQAGYATNPRYPELLIGIIEQYNLSRFDIRVTEDTAGAPLPVILKEIELPVKAPGKYGTISLERDVMEVNGVAYVVANGLDTWKSLAREFDLSATELIRFNDAARNDSIPAGSRIYIERKKRQSAEHIDKHVVDDGDTMLSISQRYGVRIDCIRKYNGLRKGEEPVPGSVLKLRKTDEIKQQ